MKLKNKGKVYPSPSSSSSSSASNGGGGDDYLSILKLLPAAILALASVLSLEDREVLAYLITRSLNTTTTAAAPSKKKPSKKPPPSSAAGHKPPVFDCDCFDCYTSYWFRWDSSPNRELIHQVIEAFEDHLTNGEAQKPSKRSSRPKKSKTGRVPEPPDQPEPQQVPALEGGPADEAADDVTPTMEKVEVAEEMEGMHEEFPAAAENAEVETRTAAATATSSHRGLARKVLPDVLGLFNSRLWGLWNPNV